MKKIKLLSAMAAVSLGATMSAGSDDVKAAKNYINASGDLMIYGDVGDWWEGNDAFSVVAQLEQANPSGELKVRIHSDGGNFLDGLAIYNALKQSEHRIVTQIDGFAGSMATIIALAGDEIHMPRNSYQFIHLAGANCSGNHNDLRESADQLEEFSDQASTIYAERSELDKSEWLAMMSDGKGTWLSAEKCLEYGLITKIIDPVEAVAHCIDLGELPAPAGFHALMALPKTKDLTNDAAAAADNEDEEDEELKKRNQAHAAARMSVAGGDNNELSQAELNAKAITAERTRQAEMRSLAETSGVSADMLAGWLDSDTTIEAARKVAITEMAARDKAGMPSGRQGTDTVDPKATMKADISNALLHRVAPDKNPLNEGNTFAHMNLLGICREALMLGGQSVAGMAPGAIADAAMQSTSDLPSIFADVANNEMARGYATRMRTFEKFATRKTMPNFKSQNLTRLSDAPNLLSKAENGEYEIGYLEDSKETLALRTKGRVIKISREMIINDEMDSLSRVPLMMGAQAALLEMRMVFGLLGSNPKMGETGKTLFHADHKNIATAGAPSTDAIGELRKLLRLQKSKGAKGEVGFALNTPLACLVVPAALETEVEKLVTQIQAVTVAGVNPFANTIVIAEPILDETSETAWYGLGDKNLVDGLVFGYLEGEEGAYIDTRIDFKSDALELKVRHDFAAGVADYRGIVKNAGV